MAELKQISAVTEQEIGIAAQMNKEIEGVMKDSRILSSTASTLSTVSSANSSESASDSDSASQKSNLSKKKETTTPGDEPMKIQVPSWPNTNHPAIENILSLQRLQSELEDALYQRVKQEALAAAAAEVEANYLASIQQNSYMQGYDAAFMGYPPMQPPMNYPPAGGSPLVPYLLAELTDGGIPPLPTYLPSYMDPAAQWSAPAPQSRGTAFNNYAKPVAAAKNTGKSVQSVAKAKAPSSTASVNSAQDSDDAKNAAVSRTVVATKINRLGFSAEKILKEYFGQFGRIDNVCVPQKIKRVQGNASTPAQGHLRPSGLGFIVMETEEEAQAILAAGADHEVCGKLINVRAFKEGQNGNASVDEEN